MNTIIIVIIVLVVLFGMGVGVYFIMTQSDKPPTSVASFFNSILPAQKCLPKLDEVDSYGATYVIDSTGKCMVDTCKPGYNFYYGKPGSMQDKFKRCQ